MHSDFKDLLAAFASAKVKYMVIGGYAVSYYSRPRFTKDIDMWIGQDDLICAKRAAGRPQDLIDLEALQGDT